MLDYPDTITVRRATAGTGAANSGKPTGGTAATLYTGAADVQDGAETLKHLQDGMGEWTDGNALVYFPPSGAQAFSTVRINDLIETPIGSGAVVGIRHTDAALAVRIDRATGSVPVIL